MTPFTPDRRDNAELGKMGPDRINHRGLLADEQMAGAVKHQAALLLGRLCWHEPHSITNGLMHRSRKFLFDYLIGTAERREWHWDAEGLGGFQVDDQFDLRGLLDRQVGRIARLRIRPAPFRTGAPKGTISELFSPISWQAASD